MKGFSGRYYVRDNEDDLYKQREGRRLTRMRLFLKGQTFKKFFGFSGTRIPPFIQKAWMKPFRTPRDAGLVWAFMYITQGGGEDGKYMADAFTAIFDVDPDEPGRPYRAPENTGQPELFDEHEEMQWPSIIERDARFLERTRQTLYRPLLKFGYQKRGVRVHLFWEDERGRFTDRSREWKETQAYLTGYVEAMYIHGEWPDDLFPGQVMLNVWMPKPKVIRWNMKTLSSQGKFWYLK